MAIDGIGWDGSYMANEGENHALVAGDEAPTEFALMAKSSSSSKNKVYHMLRLDLLNLKHKKLSSVKKIRGLERDVEVRNNKIEYLMNELEQFPPPAQVYSPPKKDLSWTGLPEFVDDTVTNYSRHAPSIDTSKCNSSDLQSSNFSVTEHVESSDSIMSKPMIKFVKAADCPGVIKTNKTKTARKSPVKYAEMYRNTSKSPKVRGNLQTWPKNNFAHKNVTPRAVLLKTGKTPINRPHMNVAQPKMISFTKTAHSNVKRHFQRKLAVKTQPRVPRVSTVTEKIPTVDSKFSTAKSTFTVDLGNKRKAIKASACWILRPKQNTTEQGPNCNGVSVTFKKYQYIDTQGRLKSYEPYDGGYVSFGQGGGKITGKGIIKTSKLEFENVYFVKELKYNLFSVSLICDNKNSILFTDSECIVLGKDFKLKDDTNVLPRTLRQHNIYSIDLNNIVPHKNLTCLVAKALIDESTLWHRRLGHLNFKTMNKLVRNNLVRGFPSKCFENDHTCVSFLKGKQHKASCKTKLVNSVSKPFHTLHIDLFRPTFVSSLNHKWYFLVVTDDFSRFTWTFFLRTMDETSSILRNFITEIENLKDLKVKIIRCDNEGEFKNKEMNEFCTKKGIRREFNNARTPQQNGDAERRNRTLIEAARTMVLVNKSQNKTPCELFNSRIPAIGFLRPFGCHVMILNTLDHLGKFDAKGDEGTQDGASQALQKDVSSLCYIALLNWFHKAHMETKNSDGRNADDPESSGISNPTATSKVPSTEQEKPAISLTVETKIPTVSSPVPTVCLDTSPGSSCDPRIILKGDFSQQETPSLGNALTLSNRFKDIFGEEADLSNMETSIPVSPTPTIRIHKDHPKSQIIGPVDTPVQTRLKSKEMEEQSFIATIHHKTNPELLQFCLFLCFLSQEEPKKIFDALKDPSWVEAIQEELLQFKIQNVWILVDCPKGVRPIGTNWVLKNKKDERGIMIRNKARLVAQGYTQEEGIDYEEIFAPVARIEAIRLFLAYASFMGFTIYQMDVKSAFLYDTINEEVYVMQPPRFQDPEFPDRVYKVDKAMYGLHQAPRAWYGTLSKYLLDNGFQRDVRSANTPMDKENPWEKDGPGKDVELYLYSFMIGSLMYLTASRPDIMFVVCAYARHQVTPKECHLHAVKRIFRYLKGQPKLGLWFPKDSPFDLVAYSDSDYGGVTQDRKSTTGGVSF
uniref:Integrase catalytic domain-containing protein n=1 Tax=Tanacetum cinerariifolium TaxID=118510 RepID=A0A6L2L287_TANCI|nr:hypothetical protein [Tanacetum cinerariifolium]